MIDSREAGRRIARLRQQAGLTQSQLAAMMNVSHQAVSKWEGGQALPDIQTLMELTRFFGLTVEQLIGEDRPAETPLEEIADPQAPRPEAQGDERTEVNCMNLQQLLQMAPYMTKEAVAEIALAMDEPLSAGQIARLAPYLPQESLEALIAKHHPEFTWESLRRLAPHMRREKVDEIARAIASGKETVKSADDGFNRTMNDIGKAIDEFGKGVDKAVRKALRFGESVFGEVSSAFGEMASDANYEKQRSERAKDLRRRAFEKALNDERWDWLGAHVDELDDGDELKIKIANRARELNMSEWLNEHMPNCADELAVDAAMREGRWDWLSESLPQMDADTQRRVANAALEAEAWAWLEANVGTVDLGEDADAFVRALWRKGQKQLAARMAEGRFTVEQYDALFQDAVQAEDDEMADLLWSCVSPRRVRERLTAMAVANEWARVEEYVGYAEPECVEELMELALEQGNFEAVDFLDERL